jgi:hypothetical protein
MGGELGIRHQGMSAEGDDVIAGRRAGSKLLLQDVEHHRHRHGAGAVRDDDEYALAVEFQIVSGPGDDLSDLVAVETPVCGGLT